MAEHPVARFRQVFDARLRSGKYEPIDVVQAVKGLTTSAQLVQSLDIFCARFDPEKPPGSRNSFELCRTTGFNLFKRALDLSNAQNELLGMVLSFGSTTAPKLKDAQLAKRFSGYRKRWDVLDAGDRAKLQLQAGLLSSDRRAEAAKRRFLLDDLEKEFRNRRGRAPQGKELFGFDPGPAGARKEFERLATACEVAFIPKNPGTTGIWFLGQFIPTPGLKQQPQTSSVRAMQNVQAAFDAFGRFVERQLNQPLDLFRLLAWAREPSSMYDTVEVKAGKQEPPPPKPWSNVWFELYQDIAVRGVVVAVNDWTVAPMIQARGYAGKDLQFILAPLDPKGQELLRVRLADSFSRRGASYPKPAFNDAQSARRQAKVWGDLKGLVLVNELEYKSLMQELAAQVTADPLAVLARKISIRGDPVVYQASYHIYESATDVFTVVWIPKQTGTEMAYIEVHALPGLYFQAWGNRVGLQTLLEDHAYGELAKAAAALVQFLLVYLEVLGYALDIATAGVSGGVRHVIFRFVEERIKDKIVSEGLKLAEIDNPWVKAVAGLAVGMTPSVRGGLKMGALKDLEELDRGAQNVMRVPPAVRHTPHVAEREGSAAVSSHAEPTIPQTKLPANDNALIRGTAAPANDNRLAEPTLAELEKHAATAEQAQQVASEIAQLEDQIAQEESQQLAGAAVASAGGGRRSIPVTSRGTTVASSGVAAKGTGGSLESAAPRAGRQAAGRTVLDPALSAKMGIDAKMQKWIEDVAAEWRKQSARFKKPGLSAQEGGRRAHKATQRAIKQQHPDTIVEELTGVSSSRQSRVSDLEQAPHTGAVGELKPWAWRMPNGRLATSREAIESGIETLQIQAYGIVARDIKRPVFVFTGDGNVWTTNPSGRGWVRIGRPSD